jgi:hypothetical protein
MPTSCIDAFSAGLWEVNGSLKQSTGRVKRFHQFIGFNLLENEEDEE